MTPENKLQYNQAMDSLYMLATNGQRIFYSNPSFTTVDGIAAPVCILFKMKQLIKRDEIEDLKFYEHGKYRNKVANDLYLNRLCALVKDRTWKNNNKRMSSRITFEWPSCVFEEWIEKEHDCHWMTAQWFTEDASLWDDYALLTTVYAPVKGNLEDYKDRYGSAFVMTKLMCDV